MDASIVRLTQRDRVFVTIRANVDELIPVVASRASKETTSLINLRINGGKNDFQPAVATFPHGTLPDTASKYLSARLEQ